MTNTFNRAPLTVNTPSSSEVKQYFFNHYQWKGLNTNANFLAVDQETFSDCNNVYVDTEGLLKSRPSLKLKFAKYTVDGIEYTLSNIVDIWTFEYVIVYKTFADNKYHLTFVNDNMNDSVQIELQSENIKLIVADEKIFVFSEQSLNYYDMKDNSYNDATSYIHIPVTKVITDGIADSEVEVESPNILTASYITKYLYTSANQINFNNFVGKTVTVEIDGKAYNIQFKYNNQRIFVSKYTGLSDYNFADEYIIGRSGKGVPLIDVSEKGNMIVSSFSSTLNKDFGDGKPIVDWIIYHTVDGIVFNKLPEISNIIGIPKISRTGNYCIVFKDDGPYIYSLLKTDESIKYPEWRNLLATIDNDTYTSLNLHLNEVNADWTPSYGNNFNQSVQVNGYFLDDKLFAFVYGTQNNSANGDPTYDNFYCIYCKGDDVIRKDVILEKNNKQLIVDNDTYTSVSIERQFPLVHLDYNNLENKIAIGVNFAAWGRSSTGAYQYLDILYRIDDTSSEVINSRGYSSANKIHICKNAISVKYNNYKIARYIIQDESLLTVVDSIIFDETNTLNTATSTIATVATEKYTSDDFTNRRLVFSDPDDYLLSNTSLFDYTDYTSNGTYTPISLLFSATPVAYYSESGYDALYLTTDKTLYASNANKLISIDELTEGDTNYLLPSSVALLSNYYFSKDNTLYISSPSVSYTTDEHNKIIKTANTFEWYFPEIAKQSFDFDITNLHVISQNEVAIFFEHSVNYVSWDADASAYRYYKSKIQTGCKKGSDVITSYDGKYVLFVSERGLVAMTYQEFMATTEQTLNYLSDGIFTKFNNYIANNEIKLFKYAHWIIVYRQNTNYLFLLDIRNNSWWPQTYLKNVIKFIVKNNDLCLLADGNLFDEDKSEIEYYDYDGKKHNIRWFIESQKLHLNAINYHKHISNITFTSVHDISKLGNVNNLYFKLQTNNYRKYISGNIDEDDYITIDYMVNGAKTHVQRLNYSKVNEFQYKLSSDDDTAINIPLSLNSITIKYKVGNQVR